MMRRLTFGMMYLLGRPMWDTGVSPPELVEVVEGGLAPGRALDLGCGTGTNVIYLARRGWQATGVDFVPRAIRQAKRKARAAGVAVDLRVGDVTDLSALAPPFHLSLDMGCYHSLPESKRPAYLRELARLMAPGSLSLMYAFLPSEGARRFGISREEAERIFAPAFQLANFVEGAGRPSAWFTFRRIADR